MRNMKAKASRLAIIKGPPSLKRLPARAVLVIPGEPLMTKMWLKPRGEINHICVVNFLGKFSLIDAVETPRVPMP